MTTATHATQQNADGIHGILALPDVADQAARLAASVLSTDIGKIVRQTDVGSWWALLKRETFPYHWNAKHKARVGLLETQEKVVDVPADKDDEQLYLYYNGPKRLPALAFHFDEDGPKEDKVAMRNKESVSINDCQNDFGSFDVPEWRDLKFAEGIEFDAQPLPENFRMAFTTSDDDDSYTRLLRREGDELKVMLKGRTVTIPARQPALQYKNTERGTECTYR